MGTAPKLDRVKARPRPDMWRDDELMTLAEAAALHWPDGPLTETSLRTAARDGRLPISQIAGKFFVTRVALRSLTVCEPLRNEVPAPVPTASPTGKKYLADLAEITSMRRRAGIDANR